MAAGSEMAHAMDTIRSAADRMRDDARFKCIFEEWPAASEDDLDAWEERADGEPGMAGYRVPAALRAIYRVTGGFRWRWQFLPDLPATITTGSAELTDLFALYQRDDETDQPLSMIYRAPRTLDTIGEQERVVIRFSPDAPAALPLVHIDDEESMQAVLTLDVESYIPSLARYRAVYGWQSLFHEKPAPRDETRRRLDAIIERIFL